MKNKDWRGEKGKFYDCGYYDAIEEFEYMINELYDYYKIKLDTEAQIPLIKIRKYLRDIKEKEKKQE